ncbi:hypothetical protein VP01_2671g3 [Puccinia sorghi]|uniref:Uncharacterized protein n=1 Tax=Puccinia sorghi TaxID=27349 RepID=A0A0L6V3V7_9BASI|nr:hypothetical protein VP01_2671g3 [Puccinia sorghi]
MRSLTVPLIALTLIAQTSAHLSLINIYGSNDIVGHAFGVNIYGKYPRAKGELGDVGKTRHAGGDSGVFETGTDDPSPACGSTPELGPIDIPAWMSQAEGDGLPAAYANMSVVVEGFQVNRDGGGPMSCEYNEVGALLSCVVIFTLSCCLLTTNHSNQDATATSWKPMFMTLNQAGNSGIQNQLRTNSTLVMNFPSDAKCIGGWTQTACIVRCRTGVRKRFGGCFAVKLSEALERTLTTTSSAEANDAVLVARPAVTDGSSSSPSMDLSDEQMSLLANQVIIQMKNQGFVFASSSNSTERTSVDASPSSSEEEVSTLPAPSNSALETSVNAQPWSSESSSPSKQAKGVPVETNATVSVPKSSVEQTAPSKLRDAQMSSSSDSSTLDVSIGTKPLLPVLESPAEKTVPSKLWDTKISTSSSNSTTKASDDAKPPVPAPGRPAEQTVPTKQRDAAIISTPYNSTLDASDLADDKLYNNSSGIPSTKPPTPVLNLAEAPLSKS